MTLLHPLSDQSISSIKLSESSEQPEVCRKQSQRKKKYVLGSGASGFDRLLVSEQTYGHATTDLVHSLRSESVPVFPRPPVTMAVLACGSGAQLPSLSEVVGAEGWMHCSDISEEQIESARAYAFEKNLTRLDFAVEPIEKGTSIKQFDVVYARFVLVHLEDPVGTLEAMWAMTKPGGLMLSEEHSIKSLHGEPASEAIVQAKDILYRAGKSRGVDFELGDTLEQVFEKAHINITGIKRQNFGFTEGNPKRLFEMSLQEGSKNYIEEGLVSREAIADLVRELSDYNKRPDTRFFVGDFVQAWAKKPINL